MRKGPATVAIFATLVGAGFATGVWATQGTTIFHRLQSLDAQKASSQQRIERLTNRVQETDAELDRRWEHVDIALRAARPIRHQVNDALVGWLSAFRKARRVSESPVADADTRRLLRTAAVHALPAKLDDLDVIQRADSERDAFARLVGQRAATSTELARSKAIVESAARQRQKFVQGARTQGAETDLEATSSALTKRLAEVETPDPEFDFHRFKGTLARPLTGEPDHQFGASGTLVRPQGWTWRAEKGTEVRAIGAGTVTYVGSVEGWGLIAVVDHGGPYRSIYAHLQQVDVQPGDELERAAVLGRVGESGSIDGSKLYLELRKDARPVDPAPWFVQH